MKASRDTRRRGKMEEGGRDGGREGGRERLGKREQPFE
jgi:hypothetical protein